MRRFAAPGVVLLVALGAIVAPAPAFAEAPTTETSSAGPAAPLVVILDTSGSMLDQVAGVQKLQAAKRALGPVIDSQAAGGNFGIWTYPSGSQCGAGGYLHEVGARSADVPSAYATAAEITLKVDELGAGGGTPTAAAMQAVADDLTARGFAEANLLLVSDGESNCNADPCAVAQQLVSAGFDITVQAVGFDISSAGRTELECIAAATGGRYFDADDGEDLERVISEIGIPQLSITVQAVDRPLAGQPTTISVVVTNPSGLDAVDVRVNLAFRDAGARTVFPAVVPATIALGNIPPGATLTSARWTVTYGERGQSVDAAYAVTAWSRGSAAARVERAVSTRTEGYTTDDLGVVFAGLAEADQSLLILGDSYSSGEGTGQYLDSAAGALAGCHRSAETYLVPQLDARQIDVDILACSGATTGDFFAQQRVGGSIVANPQLQQLQSLDRTPGAAVLTIGGNNVGFAEIIAWCHLDCDSILLSLWRDQKFRDISAISDSLERTYVDAWKTLNSPAFLERRSGAFAPVVVLAYPQLVHDTRFGECGVFNPWEVAFLNELSLALNARIKAAVAAARAQGYEVYFVDRTASAFLPDRTVCAPKGDRWINGLILPKQPESYHPTGDGYAAITDAIIEWSETVERAEPSATVADAARSGRNAALQFALFGDLRVPPRIELETVPLLPVSRGEQVTVHDTGYRPGEVVTLTLHSAPVTLGSFVADDDGEVLGTVWIPDTTPTGQHELVMTGVGADGEFRERGVGIGVIPATPLWVPLVIAASALSALAAIVLFVLARRARRAPSVRAVS